MLGGALEKRKQDTCWLRVVEETTEVLAGGETTAAAVLEDSTHVGRGHTRHFPEGKHNIVSNVRYLVFGNIGTLIFDSVPYRVLLNPI